MCLNSNPTVKVCSVECGGNFTIHYGPITFLAIKFRSATYREGITQLYLSIAEYPLRRIFPQAENSVNQNKLRRIKYQKMYSYGFFWFEKDY